MKIAILEDNPTVYEYMKLALELAGHHVQVYTHAAALLETLLSAESGSSELPYDLITVDVHLPGGLSGLDFIQRIRHTPATKHLPMIIITSASPSFLGPLQDSYPPIPVLQKPFPMKRLLHLLEEIGRVEDKAAELEPGDQLSSYNP